MGEKEPNEEIELSSEHSQFDASGESDSETVHKLPTTGICSDNGVAIEAKFPKLVRFAPDRKNSTDTLSDLAPIAQKFSPRYLQGHRVQSLESEWSSDDAKSLKSRNDIQRENLLNMMRLLGQYTWFVIY